MTVYQRLTDAELFSLPDEEQAVARAFRNYLDAAASGAGKEELETLGLLLELAVLHTERDSVTPQELFTEHLELT